MSQDALKPTVPESKLEQMAVDAEGFARDNKINLGEVCKGHVVSEDQAATTLDYLNANMVAVQSVYRPSGIFPRDGIPTMTLTTIAGGVVGAIAFFVVAAICSIIIVPILLLNIALGFAGCISYFASGALIIVGFGSCIATFISVGVVNCVAVMWAGRRAKNRSADAAAILSRAGAVLSILILVGVAWLGREWLQVTLEIKPESFNYGVLIFAAGGGVVSILAAGYYARNEIQRNPFCEICQQFMVQKTKQLPLGALKAIVKALRHEKQSTAAGLCLAPVGNDGEVRFSACPLCSQGYLEVSLETQLQWARENQVKSQREERLVASVAIAPPEVEQFRTVLGN